MPDAGDRPGDVAEALGDTCARGLGQLANAGQRHHLRIEVHAQLARPLPLGRSNVDAVNAGPREQFALQALDARIGGIPHVGKHNGNVQAQLARGGIHIDLVSAAQMNLSVHSAGECHATARSLRPVHAIQKQELRQGGVRPRDHAMGGRKGCVERWASARTAAMGV